MSRTHNHPTGGFAEPVSSVLPSTVFAYYPPRDQVYEARITIGPETPSVFVKELGISIEVSWDRLLKAIASTDELLII